MRARRGRCAARVAAPDPDCEPFIENSKEELIYVTTAIDSVVPTRSLQTGPDSITHLRIDHGLAMDVLHV
jgi:hypothetical protein